MTTAATNEESEHVTQQAKREEWRRRFDLCDSAEKPAKEREVAVKKKQEQRRRH